MRGVRRPSHGAQRVQSVFAACPYHFRHRCISSLTDADRDGQRAVTMFDSVTEKAGETLGLTPVCCTAS
ncbi:hypothetical protein LSTR_LSTR001632 [Laodelphax striatellus]|uniref:Uncharacterized protein n=1 Tax=Laodelphax striatellus TaxID=195883 RepID=A0A482XDH9_LAOST|nr:hypothetical protein LSTR_LSTR017461 [Laodelphax striatellus]RZF43371.1 hypothetical protein LSTR_LSTR001632 [Laodelphax striatellus]